jgi:hypothetical protein
MAVGIRKVVLGLPGWGAIGLPGQASPGHHLDGQKLQIRGLHSGVLGSLNRLVSRGLGPGCCRLGLPVELGLLNIWCIRLSGSRRSGPGLLCFLLPLPSRRCSSLRFHLLAGLTNPGQTVLTPS